MNTFYRQALAGLRILLVLTVLTGVLYPLSVWVVSRIPGLHGNAEGSIVTVNGHDVGSDLIGVDPKPADPAHDPWFHTRPSAVTDPSTSGASNKSADNADYLTVVRDRLAAVAQREGVDPAQVPADAVTASASGLDPAISPTYARLQVARVARETGLSQDTVRALVERNTTGRGLGFLGDPGVNVLRLNVAVQAARAGGH